MAPIKPITSANLQATQPQRQVSQQQPDARNNGLLSSCVAPVFNTDVYHAKLATYSASNGSSNSWLSAVSTQEGNKCQKHGTSGAVASQSKSRIT